ncbi:MAG: DNA repair protein RecN [Lachnoclostridium edouardi]|uniref:DNA repair protein RecN n=1 Tax=Lachnoclostridium edouardi TaxID=1926283 RepID=UPI0026DBACDE|nr:DNA repair protein RecN [Lachnoclostridium edouardi]MDO4278914.1 DNA repair protein RecN [Lachnoclostridium edouardi]
MLLELHVRNLALIERADVEFGQGLNILTGETGAGKSIILGSVNLALGKKASRDMIRQGEEYAYIELLFSVTEPEKVQALKELEVYLPEDGTLIISRKIMGTRSISRLNDETVTAARLKTITSLLLDIHGQHDHQSLLYKSKHLEILDDYLRHDTQPVKQKIADMYSSYTKLQKKMQSFYEDEESRIREADFLRFEVEEIENAGLKEGEEEELAVSHRRFVNGQKIIEALSKAYEAVQVTDLGDALKHVAQAAEYEEGLGPIRDQLFDAEAILSDAAREISSYMDSLNFDEEEFARIESRLDQIRNLQAKYGGTVSQVLKSLEEKKKRLEVLENFDFLKQETEKQVEIARNQLESYCEQLSEMRKSASEKLVKEIKESLLDLNFIDVEFEMEFKRLDHYTPEGYDEAEFMISTNPGEPVKPLGMVASGGELSRIMLAIKTVLADSDDIPTLIFDEIDTGISGRTAQKVSEKLRYIARLRQVICITHLPQIAAMADCHFEIAKKAKDNRTSTVIRRLSEEEMVMELARLLGGVKITDAVLKNAKEMKKMAKKSN